ncbi:hypothetical protein [Actinoplanes utahensis]|uniref:Uncharacterized protein n=1 Tax=Actinoplanes utahensis TaxID=1869 RepID=A0A0A6UFI2_ACTUT|nr:hypothetical protein [Actinoplanes utahensis]KHD73813.1 hypothetical protein MB27_32755 [Actinoplanes utahensis]GIF27814.1 hypothetical protein Aut01nite_08000 [Actinoplanes utahensis]
MSDQLEEIFVRARPDAIREVRPPGAEAARSTVRRRRRRRAVVLATAAVFAVLGGVVTWIAPSSPPPTPPAATPVDLPGAAKAALGPVTAPAAVAVAQQAAVKSTWKATSASHLGELTLRAACAGTGTMTLIVDGIPGGESLEKEPVEVTRLKLPCTDRPEPATERYVLGQGFTTVEYRIEDAADAEGRAVFAFRVTVETGKPLDGSGDDSYAISALRLTEEQSNTGYGFGSPIDENRSHEEEVPSRFGTRFRVMTACTGIGTLTIELRQAGGKLVDTTTATCRWPAKRYDWEPARGSGKLVLHVAYQPTTDSRAGADFMIQLEKR